jgi:hypothetical protein
VTPIGGAGAVETDQGVEMDGAAAWELHHLRVTAPSPPPGHPGRWDAEAVSHRAVEGDGETVATGGREPLPHDVRERSRSSPHTTAASTDRQTGDRRPVRDGRPRRLWRDSASDRGNRWAFPGVAIREGLDAYSLAGFLRPLW